MVMNTRGDVFNLSPRVYENELKNYNCGGYALGIYEWWIPYMTPSRIESDYNEVYDEADYYDEDDVSEDAIRARENFEYWDERYSDMIDGFEYLFRLCFNREYTANDEWDLSEFDNKMSLDFSIFILLRSFKWLRRVNSFKELHDDEYGIVFAVGHGDFHFVRYENGIFTHKMGGSDIEVVKKWKEAFHSPYGDEVRYDAGHAFFAAKKEGLR
jgi:hypothetical protein